jgi:beta-fructofuranosidase
MSDHLFPKFHVRPPRGYLNDPNGPIVVDGLVHLYFQYRHTVDMAAPVLWAHVTSPDFVHWTYHRPAIVPHPHRGDRDGCWSGNTVQDDSGAVRAFYSGLVHGEPLQRTLSAVSSDGGFTFGPPCEVVAAPAEDEGIMQLRDPFVWREGDTWRMALGAGTSDTATVRLYRSDDLETWSCTGLLARMSRARTEAWDSGVMWECPQVARLDGSLVALVGAWAPETGTMRVLSFVAPDAGPELEPSELHLVDQGPDFYAASVLPVSPLGALLWGWATEARAEGWCREEGWSGVLTLPRIVSLRADGTLGSAPLPALAALRRDQDGQVVGSGLDGLGAQMEFLLEPGLDASGVCTLRLRFGLAEHLEVTLDLVTGRASVDRRHASTDPRAAGGVHTTEAIDELKAPGATVRGFVDGSVLELFLPGGTVMTTRFYPTSPPPWRLELDGGSSARVTVWELAAPGLSANAGSERGPVAPG